MRQSFRHHSGHSETVLCNGDKLSQREFHRIYSKIDEHYRAELIAGMVYEPPPPSLMHSVENGAVMHMLKTYSIFTPGTQSGSNGTVVLSDEDEVQPDSFLRILPEYGGQSKNWRRVVKGAPELVAEVSFSSRSIDLHLKKERYAKAGVKEYIVFSIEPRQFYWFNMQDSSLIKLDGEGVSRSKIFPGLWINTRALLNSEERTVFDCVMAGIASDAHTDFAAFLESRKNSGA